MKAWIVLIVLSLNFSCYAGLWLKGDFHAHSNYSDGDSSVLKVIAKVESLNLDFFTLTDHDSKMGGQMKHWSDSAYKSDKVLLLYGTEWTTRFGHANIISDQPFNYAPFWQANKNRNAQEAIDEAQSIGAIFSINHPKGIGTPWRYEMLTDSLEIWNALYNYYNRNGWTIHNIWDKQLLEGKKVTARGGSDTHKLRGLLSKLFSYGNPTTWVYADEKSTKGVLDGMKKGRTVISYAPDAPRLELAVAWGKQGEQLKIGDNGEQIQGEVHINLSIFSTYEKSEKLAAEVVAGKIVEDLQSGQLPIDEFLNEKKNPYSVGVFKNGRLLKVFKLRNLSGKLSFPDQVNPGERIYYRAELIGKPKVSFPKSLLYGHMISMTSPIYINY